MIRLVASDIDGTLLTGGASAIPGEIFEHIRRLERRGILFCPASGRQYSSLRRLFAPVADRVPYLCENGAVVFGPGGAVLGKTPMPRAEAEAICRDILETEGCEVLISGENMSYLVPRRQDISGLMREEKHNRVTVLERPEDTPEEIVKVSAYCAAGTEAIPAWLAEKWRAFNPAVAGREWLDFTLADKGTGLEQLCAALGIAPAEVMAFGDNWNDVPMLALAGEPWLMETADAPLLARFPNHCAAVAEILKKL